MSKKKIIAVVFLCIAMFGIVTMTGCGGAEAEPTEPRIKTTIDPKNWARVEDYAVYETEPVVEETEPAPTEAVVEETAPVPEATESPVVETQPPTVYYNVAKDITRAFTTGDLGELYIGEDNINLLTATVSDLEALGFVKGDAEKNSGVRYQYLFDGFVYTKDSTSIYVDADENGLIRGIKLTNPGVSIINNTISVGMDLNNFYDAIEQSLAEGEHIGRMIPAEGVNSYSQVASAGYRAVFTCTSDGLKEIAIFVEDYVSTWGPITN